MCFKIDIEINRDAHTGTPRVVRCLRAPPHRYAHHRREVGRSHSRTKKTSGSCSVRDRPRAPAADRL